jgi:hypothetical protein
VRWRSATTTPSPHYEDFLFPYIANEPMPLVFDIDEAAANAEQTVIFQ